MSALIERVRILPVRRRGPGFDPELSRSSGGHSLSMCRSQVTSICAKHASGPSESADMLEGSAVKRVLAEYEVVNGD
jgi:hypothetical protein